MRQLKTVIFDAGSRLAKTVRDGYGIALNRAFIAAGLNELWDEALYEKLQAVSARNNPIGYFSKRVHLDSLLEDNTDNVITHLCAAKPSLWFI